MVTVRTHLSSSMHLSTRTSSNRRRWDNEWESTRFAIGCSLQSRYVGVWELHVSSPHPFFLVYSHLLEFFPRSVPSSRRWGDAGVAQEASPRGTALTKSLVGLPGSWICGDLDNRRHPRLSANPSRKSKSTGGPGILPHQTSYQAGSVGARQDRGIFCLILRVVRPPSLGRGMFW